jgi:hypothetical protein
LRRIPSDAEGVQKLFNSSCKEKGKVSSAPIGQ